MGKDAGWSKQEGDPLQKPLGLDRKRVVTDKDQEKTLSFFERGDLSHSQQPTECHNCLLHGNQTGERER